LRREAGAAPAATLHKEALRVPETTRKQATVLGTGSDAVPVPVQVLAELGVLP
jgi:hypothetical protein